MRPVNYKFIDLFAGLGGFHTALEQLGCTCVYASEIKEDLRRLYSINYPEVKIDGDITQVDIKDIPSHDILCAGFPCQPFSQAGYREGFDDSKNRGNLFDYICAILEAKRPRYVLLENVSNLKGHDNGNTWKVIQEKLECIGYDVRSEIISPHEFGIPQHRKRIYIVCQLKEKGNLEYFSFPKANKKVTCDIRSIIDENDTHVVPICEDKSEILELWEEFIQKTIQHGDSIPRFPVWAMEFGATYPYEEKDPAIQTKEELCGFKGRFGQEINGITKEDCLMQLPSYVRKPAMDRTTKKDAKPAGVLPIWKKKYIASNRSFYLKHKAWLDEWIKKIISLENSHQKMEWNCDKATPTLKDKIIQFRASGIRIKMPTYSPALNLVGTQTPIFPWIDVNKSGKVYHGRYMTIKEAAALQGMQQLKFGDDDFSLSPSRCFEALGNAVNVEIVKKIATNLLDYGK